MKAETFAFTKLVDGIAEGDEVSLSTVLNILEAAGKSAAELTIAVNELTDSEVNLTVAATEPNESAEEEHDQADDEEPDE